MSQPVQNTNFSESFEASPTSRVQLDLDNTPTKIVYQLASGSTTSKKHDFAQGVCCILQGTTAALKDDQSKNVFECSEIAQMNVNFTYDKNDEVISRFVHLKYTGEEDIFDEADITVIMPHCLSRTTALYREAVIKAKINNTWIYLNSEEISVDEYKDGRFVLTRLTSGVPTNVVVVSRYKRDVIKFSKAGSRNTSSVDQRLLIKSDPGCFTGKESFVMQMQPVDNNTICRIQNSIPNGRGLMCSSNIVSITWGEHKFKKMCTVHLPIPANPIKVKKLAKAEAVKAENSESAGGKKRRPEIRREEKLNKWYMGMYGEDENDQLFLFHYDIMSESWTHLPDVTLTELRKDLISFHMTKPLHRFVVLRCRVEMIISEARKMVYSIEEQLTMRPVRFILVQSPKEHSEVTVHCVSAQKFDAIYDDLYNFGWRFHGTEGPPKSKEVMLKEGTIFEVNFRGNVRFDERHHPAGKKTMKCFNSQMPCQLTFLITEADKHLQRNYDFFKGIAMVQQVDKGLMAADHAQVSAGSTKSSTASVQLHTKKASSNIIVDKKKVLCELLVQLAKGIEGGPQTPPAGKVCMNLDEVSVEAITIISNKLGKEWEVMAKNLGLSPGRIEALKTRNKQHPDSVKEDMLQTWMKRQPRAADRLPRLYYALMNCGRIDIAYKIEELYLGTAEGGPDINIITSGQGGLDIVSDSQLALHNENINNAGDGMSADNYQQGEDNSINSQQIDQLESEPISEQTESAQPIKSTAL